MYFCNNAQNIIGKGRHKRLDTPTRAREYRVRMAIDLSQGNLNLTENMKSGQRYGLANLGNTCYINGVIQLLAGSIEIRKALAHYSDTLGKVLTSFRAIIEAIHKGPS